MLRILRRGRPAAEPYAMPDGTPCRFHRDTPAIAAEGFAPMCLSCYYRWRRVVEEHRNAALQ